jgi:hypothetical protein
MLRRTACVLSVASGLIVTASVAMAQGHTLYVSGQAKIFADTDSSGCPDADDAGCSAMWLGHGMQPVAGDLLNVMCMQNQNYPNQVDGAYPTQTYNFAIDTFNLNGPNSSAHQTGGTRTKANNFISGAAALTNGIGLLQIFDRAGTSTARVCSDHGTVVAVTPATGPTFLRNLDKVDCTSCPCTAAGANANFLRANMAPLPALTGGFIMRDIYVPIMNNMITFASDNPTAPFLTINLGSLERCTQVAPSLTNAGLLVLGLSLLVMGTWVLGRRERFAQAIPLP